MSDNVERELGRLAEGQKFMQESITSLADSVKTIAQNQDKILEIQLQHQANSQQIEQNREAIHTLEGKCQVVQLAVAENSRFRERFVFWFVKFITPVVTIAAGGLTVAAFSGLL